MTELLDELNAANSPEVTAPDVSDAAAALEQRLDDPQPDTAAQEPPPADEGGVFDSQDTVNIWDELLGADMDPQPAADDPGAASPVPNQNFVSDPNGYPGPAPAVGGQPSEQDLINQYILNVTQGAINPQIEQLKETIEARYRQEQLAELQETYPELKDRRVIQQIRPVLDAVVKRYGNESLATDPDLVEMAYLAAKGHSTLAEATPASEVVASQGGLESGAPVSGANEAPVSPEQQVEDIFARGGTRFAV